MEVTIKTKNSSYAIVTREQGSGAVNPGVLILQDTPISEEMIEARKDMFKKAKFNLKLNLTQKKQTEEGDNL